MCTDNKEQYNNDSFACASTTSLTMPSWSDREETLSAYTATTSWDVPFIRAGRAPWLSETLFPIDEANGGDVGLSDGVVWGLIRCAG